MSAADLTAVAVGNRPGLVGSLVVGVAAAKALSWSLSVPLLGVDHVLAHLVAARLEDHRAQDNAVAHEGFRTFAAAAKGPGTFDLVHCSGASTGTHLGLVVSGGHTSLYAIEPDAKPRVLGSTIDDAVGEAFDKAAKILGLGHPGGPAIDRLAAGVPREAADARCRLPRPLLGRDSLDFSFSGLKTALLYAVRGQPEKGPDGKPVFPRSEADLGDDERTALAAALQFAAVDVIVKKLGRAADAMAADDSAPGAVVLGGGVSANRHLRVRVEAWAADRGLPCRLPAPAYCVDNGAMIAAAGHDLLLAGELRRPLAPGDVDRATVALRHLPVAAAAGRFRSETRMEEQIRLRPVATSGVSGEGTSDSSRLSFHGTGQGRSRSEC